MATSTTRVTEGEKTIRELASGDSGRGTTPSLDPNTSTRSPESSICASYISSGRSTEEVTAPPSTEARCSRLSAMATMRRPSVLTMSGSSTPASWTFVVE
jgi:hypothetical protein